MNYFWYVSSYFQMNLTIMLFGILGETVINWGVKILWIFIFGSASSRIRAWTSMQASLFFYSHSSSLVFSSKRSHATLMRIKGFSGRIRCVVICRRLIEEHTQCVICNLAFCEKMKTNVVALPFFGLDIAQNLARPNANYAEFDDTLAWIVNFVFYCGGGH